MKRRVHSIATIVKNIGLFSSMPNKKLTKEENQPPITTLLPNCTKNSDTNRTLPQVSTKSTTNPSASANVSLESADLTIGAQTEPSEQQFIEIKSNKKRKRRNRSSGSPKKKPSKNQLWRIRQQ